MGPTARAFMIAALAACGGSASAPPPTAPTPPRPLASGVATELPPDAPAPADEDEDDDDEAVVGLAGAVESAPEPEPVVAELDPVPPEVKLLAKGTGKRAPLRYVARVGDPIACDVVMDMSLAQPSMTLVVPRTVLGWSGKVTTVDGRSITMSAVVDVFDVAQAQDAISQRMGHEMRTKLAPLFGATMASTVSDRGVPGHTRLVTRGQLDPAAAMGMQAGASGGLVVPEEPVGIGARWQVQRTEQVGLSTTRSTITFELVERVDGAARIHGEIAVVSTPPFGAPVIGQGVSDAWFTGGLCFRSTVTTTIPLPAPPGGTLINGLSIAPRT